MNNFLFDNDKSTIKDELYLLAFILVCIGTGAALYYFAPSILIIPGSMSRLFGLILIFVGVMFIPGLIYRLFTNEIKK